MDLDKWCRTKARYSLCELWYPSKTCTPWQSMLHRALGRGGKRDSPDVHGAGGRVPRLQIYWRDPEKGTHALSESPRVKD